MIVFEKNKNDYKNHRYASNVIKYLNVYIGLNLAIYCYCLKPQIVDQPLSLVVLILQEIRLMFHLNITYYKRGLLKVL